MQHKWLAPQKFIELKRAYSGGMAYKEMAYRFDMTIGQLSWYLRDMPKRHPRKEGRVTPHAQILNRNKMALLHKIAKQELKKEIALAKSESKTAPLYRPHADKVW